MINTPNIIEESRERLTTISILDAMLRDRQISLLGTVDEDSVNSLVTQLLYLEKAAPGEEITFYINSDGGEVGSGLALYDIMQHISSPVRTICLGRACSMAAVLFAAGDIREIYTHSKVMIHDPSISGRMTMKALELQTMSKDLMDTRQALAEILARHTGQPLERIFEKTVTDCFFDAKEAIEFGLADSIIA
jgi:ATP-dependent Clp protease protease subunit